LRLETLNCFSTVIQDTSFFGSESEIEQLLDLQGFLQFASQPEWKRVKLAPQ